MTLKGRGHTPKKDIVLFLTCQSHNIAYSTKPWWYINRKLLTNAAVHNQCAKVVSAKMCVPADSQSFVLYGSLLYNIISMMQ